MNNVTPISSRSVSPTSSVFEEASSVSIGDKKIASAVRQVFEEKTKLREDLAKKPADLSSTIMIGGDLFTMASLGFQGVQALLPATAAKVAGFALTSFIFGEIAGAINIGVAFIELKEAYEAFKVQDHKLGIRLFFDFLCLFSIGVVMILIATASKVAALGAIGAFFAANPWVLPVLFFIISIPMIVEMCRREGLIWSGKDLASQLDTKQLDVAIRNGTFTLPALFDIEYSSDEELQNKLIERVDTFQAEMGVDAALAAFRLWQAMLDRNTEASQAEFQELNKRIHEWHFAQHVRSLQQFLYFIGFVLSMGALKPTHLSKMLNACVNFSMSLANAIPLYMDIFWPFKRNVPKVVPSVNPENLTPQKTDAQLNHSQSSSRYGTPLPPLAHAM